MKLYLPRFIYEIDPQSNAHRLVAKALQSGRLVNPGECSQCGKKQSQGHHPKYSRPLEVVWLCRSCHRLIHPGGYRHPGRDIFRIWRKKVEHWDLILSTPNPPKRGRKPKSRRPYRSKLTSLKLTDAHSTV